MPKLRAVRTKEEAGLVPADESLQIVLAPEGEVEVEQPDKKDGDDKAESKVEVRAEPEREEPDESAALKKRYDDLVKAEQKARDDLQAAQERERKANQERDASRQESTQHREEADEARFVAILNALDAAESEAQSASGAFEQAVANGDYKAQSEANRRLAKAEAAISRHEEAKAAYEEAKKTKTEKKPETQAQQSQQDLFENAIKALPDVAKNWLRSHPEYITDSAKNEDIQYFHQTAIRGGLRAYSPEYFESIEIQAGLRKKPDQVVEDEDDEVEVEPPVRQRSKVVTQAPPTRDAVSVSTGKPSSTRVTLSPAQREAARISGVDEISYAKGVLELEKRKKNGMYQERG